MRSKKQTRPARCSKLKGCTPQSYQYVQRQHERRSSTRCTSQARRQAHGPTCFLEAYVDYAGTRDITRR